ncbi:leucine-rich repeat-containing protein [Salix suchowensis]|nr:leucine-rich repeat-containing protein [Salix suchowensis]
MGFKTVYKCLTDVFPQVDVRILKAVAIEHSKDADVAVEVVLSEIIPSLSRHSAVPSPPCEDTTPSLPSDGEIESCVDDIASAATYSVAEQTPDSAEDGHHSDFSGDSENMNSKQLGQIELLEENVEAAKDNKKTLFLEMESVMILMKEAELKEMAAEQAKDEAARGGLDILIKVELKQMLVRAKEANGMHAGEVYGEKAILATEVRELQARLLSLSDEKDNALAILDEMRQTLKSRLAAAEELMKIAELEKLEKEEAAQNALVEQEIIMAKVVQESKILQKEAEENAKLREFLMDRGCVVDTLQGEISVICQDVRLLKEKFDERVPLSKSVSSSQTSCILASSGTSVKSLASDLGAEIGETSELPKEPVLACSADDVQSPELHHESVERASSDKKQLLDDEWDFV